MELLPAVVYLFNDTIAVVRIIDSSSLYLASAGGCVPVWPGAVLAGALLPLGAGLAAPPEEGALLLLLSLFCDDEAAGDASGEAAGDPAQPASIPVSRVSARSTSSIRLVVFFIFSPFFLLTVFFILVVYEWFVRVVREKNPSLLYIFLEQSCKRSLDLVQPACIAPHDQVEVVLRNI